MKRSIVLAVTVAIAISGCVGGDPPPTPGPTPGVSPGTQPPRSTPEPPEEVDTPSPSDSGTGGQDEPSVFGGPRETPPGGVAEFLEAIPGGGIEGPCIVNPPEELPGIAMHETVIPTSLCGQGFIPGEEVALLLRGPGGREWTAQVTTDDEGGFEWGFEQLPRRLQGEYFGQAIQGDVSVERTFDVSLESLVAAVVPRYFPLGGSTEFVIAGGQPAQSVPAHLYRKNSAGDGFDFIADLGPLTLNDNGQVRVDLNSRLRDEAGTYLVVTAPGAEDIGYWFALGLSDPAQ